MTAQPPPAGERRRADPGGPPPGVPERRVPTEQVTVLGVDVAVLPTSRALAQVSSLIERGATGTVVFANANLLNIAAHRADVRAAVNSAAVVLNDGAGVALAAKLKGTVFPENLNGTDFTPRLLATAAERGWRVAMLGARPWVAERAVCRLRQQLPDLQVCYVNDGYFGAQRSATMARQIRAARADLLLVALGNPRQELWLQQHLPATGARVGVAVGAYFDFAAGRVRRAPRWMRTLHLEWLFRLLQEPRRLFARYVLGIPVFCTRLLEDSAHRHSPRTPAAAARSGVHPAAAPIADRAAARRRFRPGQRRRPVVRASAQTDAQPPT